MTTVRGRMSYNICKAVTIKKTVYTHLPTKTPIFGSAKG